MRVITASGIDPSAIAGRIRCLIDVPERVPVAGDDRVEDVEVRRVLRVRSVTSIRPTLGNSCHLTAKKYFSRIARKKIGIEIPISDPTRRPVVEESAVPLGREEAERDAEHGREDHRRRARARSSRGSAARSRTVTVRCVATLTPRSRSRRSSSCTRSTAARSACRARSARVAWTSAGVARSPSSASAGLPGSALIQKKIRSETPSRIGTSSSNRRTMNRSTSVVRRSAAQLPRRPRSRRPVRTDPCRPGSGRSPAPTSRSRVPAASARTALPAGTS